MRPRAALLLAVTLVVLGGCGPTPAEPVPTDTSASEVPVPTAARPATRPEAPVVTRDGPCPYFGVIYAEQTIGQHLVRSTVTSTRPYPGCTLYRPDGGKAIDIRILPYPTAQAAQRRAVSLLGASANPAEVGDLGTVVIVADGARLVASKGRYLVVVFINQQSSLQAHDIATAVVNKVH